MRNTIETYSILDEREREREREREVEKERETLLSFAKFNGSFSSIENETPSISGNTTINAEVGKTVYMQFNASDDSDKRPAFRILKHPVDFQLNQTTGLSSWTPRDTNVTELRYCTMLLIVILNNLKLWFI